MGCNVAVIGVSACSERSSGFLHEDHPYEQDKASEARAGEKNSSRAVDAFVLCVVPAAVLSALFPLQDSCSPILRYVSHAEFKDLVLPTLQKSLLRSPENVIESESVISVQCSAKEPEQLFLRVLKLWGVCIPLDYAYSPVDIGRGIVWRLRAGCGEATFVV